MDIVARLRTYGKPGTYKLARFCEAADEIERLRALLELAKREIAQLKQCEQPEQTPITRT